GHFGETDGRSRFGLVLALGPFSRRRTSAPAREPVLHPIGKGGRSKGRGMINSHPHKSQRVFAWEFSAGARALVSYVGLADHDAVRRRARALAFSPDKPVALCQSWPRRRLQQLSSGCERGLIGSEPLDSFERE